MEDRVITRAHRWAAAQNCAIYYGGQGTHVYMLQLRIAALHCGQASSMEQPGLELCPCTMFLTEAWPETKQMS